MTWVEFYLEKSEEIFNKEIASLLVVEIFKRGEVLEIINFLESKYNDIETDRESDEMHEMLLVELNNKLINKYLIRYCKSRDIFFRLLELDPSLIHVGVFNKQLHLRMDDVQLNKYLITDREVLFNFFRFQLTHAYPESFVTFINNLINKQSGFEEIEDELYFDVITYIFRTTIITESWMPYNKADINWIIWSFLKNAEANTKNAKMLASIGKYDYERLSISPRAEMSINAMLEKWTNQEYEILETIDPMSVPGFERTIKIQIEDQDTWNIQALIAAYAKAPIEKSQYAGVRTHYYRYVNMYDVIRKDSLSKSAGFSNSQLLDFERDSYEKFILNNREDEMFYSFAFNEYNYTESFFEIAYELMNLDDKMILKNFSKIGKAISVISVISIHYMLSNLNLNECEKNYYMTLYFLQTYRKDVEGLNTEQAHIKEGVEILAKKKCTLW